MQQLLSPFAWLTRIGRSKRPRSADDLELLQEQVRVIYSVMPTGIIGASINALVLSYVLCDVVPRMHVYAWLGSSTLVLGGRLLLVMQFHKRQPTGPQLLPWGTAQYAMVLANSLNWAAVCLWLWPNGSFVHQVFIAFLCGGITAAAVAAYCSLRFLAETFYLPPLVLLVARFLTADFELAWVMGGMVALFLALTTQINRGLYDTTRNSLRLRLQNRDILRTLSEEKARVEELNRKLTSEVAEREQTERSLRESESRFRGLVENATDGIVVLAGGHVRYANQAALDLTGYNLAEAAAVPYWELLPDVPEGRPRIVSYHTDRMAGRAVPGQYEATLMRKDGTALDVIISSAPVEWAGERGSIAMIKDISSRAENEQALRASEFRFRTLVEGSVMGIVILNNRTPVFCNMAYARMFGYDTPEDILALDSVDGLNAQEDRERLAGYAARRMTRTEAPIRFEMKGRRRDGTPIWAECVSLMTEWDGQPMIQSTLLDITARKNAESQQQQLLVDLKHVNDELTNFAYVVSHDLTAPLRAIHSLAQWIAEDHAEVLTGEGLENLKLLQSRAVRMNGLLEGILQYSRVGRTVPDLQTIDVAALLEDVVDSLQPPEGLTVTLQQPLPKVTYDRTQLTQVLQNLIGNALTHMGKPQGQVDVGCTAQDEEWEFWVRDTGMGIDERHFERIFAIFQSLRPRDEHEATGIGLSIVKRIVESNGGRVWLESALGEGSTFHFTIPQALAERHQAVLPS